MGLNDLLDKKVQDKKKKQKAAGPGAKGDEKVNKSIRMRESTFLMLKKVTNRIEEDGGKYTHEDAILEGLSLLAKEKGIKV